MSKKETIHDAVSSGVLEKVKKLQTSSTLNSKNENGQTPLHIACAEGQAEIVKYLLKKKATVNDVDSRGWTPLHCAVTCRDLTKTIEICNNLLLTQGIEAGIASTEGATPLYYLARFIPKENEAQDYLNLLHLVLEKGGSVFVRNNQGEYPHHQAAMKGNVISLKFLLETGLHPDLSNQKGETAVHYAVMAGSKESLKLLLDLGANKYIRTNSGEYAADIAKKMDKKDLLEMLSDTKLPGFINNVIRANVSSVNMFLKGGQDVNTTDKNGMSALHHAATLANNKMIHLLLTGSKTIDASRQDQKGNNVFHYLAASPSVTALSPENNGCDIADLVKLLIDKGGKPDQVNSSAESPLHMAALHGNVRLLKALLSLNVNIEAESSTGETPIFYAIKALEKEAAGILQEKGAQNKRAKSGETPQTLATKVGLTDLANSFKGELSAKEKKEKEEKEKKEKERLEKEREKVEKEKERIEKEKKKEQEKIEKEKKAAQEKLEKEKRKTKIEKPLQLSEPTAVRQVAHVSKDLTWTGDPEEIFELEKKVGEGAFGTVYRAVHKQTGFVIAIKTLPGGDNPEAIEKEIGILRQCRDTNIVSYFGSNVKGNLLWILMEFCGAGSVGDLLKTLAKEDKTMNDEQIGAIAVQVVKGLNYLHNMKLVHRDLKPANVLLNAAGEAKIADFGVSAQLNQTIAKARTTIGTPIYMSPEVISGADYDFKFDIWSLGISMIEIAQNHLPFGDVNIMRAIGLIVNGDPPKLEHPEKYSPELSAFIATCLTKDPTKRPDSVALFTHPFIMSRLANDNKGVIHTLLEQTFGEEEVSKLDSSHMDRTSPKNTLTSSGRMPASPTIERVGTDLRQSSSPNTSQQLVESKDPEVLKSQLELVTKELKESKELVDKQKEEIDRLKKELDEWKKKYKTL